MITNHSDAADAPLLFVGTPEDKAFLPYLKPASRGHKCFVLQEMPSTIYELESYCRADHRQIARVIFSSPQLLARLASIPGAKIDNYSGSYFRRNGIEYVCVSPLEQCVTIPYGPFLLQRYIDKLIQPERWFKCPEFEWGVVEPNTRDACIGYLSSADLIAVDIETTQRDLAITSISYTGVRLSDHGISSRTFVFELAELWQLALMRTLNALPVPKIFQNGQYDCSYLARYDACPVMYYWDTAVMMHAWYSELPKDLGSLQAFYVREASYWKDLARSGDKEQQLLYNGRDTWATAMTALVWFAESPQWARDNYAMKFPLIYPSWYGGMIGLKRDMDRMQEARTAVEDMVTVKYASLRKVLSCPQFNSNSPPQVKLLLRILGSGDLASSDEASLAKAAYRHPLNARIIKYLTGVPKTKIVEDMGIRALRKLKSTYLRTDADISGTSKRGGKELNGRILYSIVPDGTDTGRNASREHHFWCGLQIQNIPGGKTVRQTLAADQGFYLGESDLEQAETRDTAYITGDERLISAVTGDKDFHSYNAAAFFGLKYDEIYDDVRKKAIDKPIRDLSKRVNHGANYNMGADMLVETMGEENLYRAKRLLDLPPGYSARDVAQYLLDQFDKTYPVIRGAYHTYIKTQIKITKVLVGATGWTRYCFGDPSKSKRQLNLYVAHPSQSLNAMVLDRAYLRVFREIAMSSKHQLNFKLLAQIHDSILFQYREGHEYLAEMVKEMMEIPITIKDITGKQRTFTVPAALKLGKVGADGQLQRATRWSDTE